MKNNVTMQDIAEQLGVSKVTVSKALNDKEGVSDELKEKIKNMARDMGYRYNVMARSLKVSHSFNIGVIIAERFTGEYKSFYTGLYQQLSKVLDTQQYSGILHILSKEDEKALNLPRIYHERKVDGFIILGQIHKKYIEVLQKIDIPIIFLDFYDDHVGIDAVITDNFYGAYELTNYLVMNGHQQIAYVGNLQATSSIQDRFLGYYKSLLEHRIPLNNDYVINDRDENGKFIDIELPAKIPSAFVCNCDQIAYTIINKLKASGYRVPEDCSVVGFDNDIYATISEPKITTVEVNVEDMTHTVVKYMIEKVKGSDKTYGRVLIKGKIIYRDSVKKINA